MTFNLSMIPVLPAFAPLICLILAIMFDRVWRKKSEKPPQSEKLLPPPGHSLSLQLEKTFGGFVDNLITACSVFTAAK
jgi:hypothetical protein